MKKLFIALLLTGCLFAEETVLLKSDVLANFEDYDYVKNFEIASDSGHFKSKDLIILEPNERGFRFMAKNVPQYQTCNYKILPAYPSFLNEANVGAGYIENAAAVKTIKVTATTNRPYDEIIVLYSKSANGPVKEIRMPQDFNSIKSMEEYELVFDNPLYEPDVSKRELVSKPVLGSDVDGIYFRGLKIKTNTPTGFSAYSEYSILCVKEIVFVYDKQFTDAQMEMKASLKEDFSINETSELKKKTREYILEKNRLKSNEKELMD